MFVFVSLYPMSCIIFICLYVVLSIRFESYILQMIVPFIFLVFSFSFGTFLLFVFCLCFFFSSRRRHTRCLSDWSSDVCSSDLDVGGRLSLNHIERSGQFLRRDRPPTSPAGHRVRLRRRPGNHGPLAQMLEQDLEIGRASCRERV